MVCCCFYCSAGRVPSNEVMAELHQLSGSTEGAAYRHISAEVEQAALHNVRQSVGNYPLSSWMAAQQGADHAGLLPDEVCYYEGEDSGVHEEDEQNIAECLAFIQQQQHAAAVAIAAASASGSARTSRLHDEASFPEDPFQQGR